MLQQQPFKGKVAIICGGSTGMGKATAKEIVQLGGSVCIIARRPDVLSEAAADIKSAIKGESQFIEMIPCDTTDIEALQPLIKKFIDNHGVPDYLINAVGYAYPSYVQDLKLDDFKKNLDTNYYGQLVPILILIPYFMKEKKGYIANISSMMGYFGIMGYATYAPSKFAIVGLTEVLRHELKPYNINFSILYPPDTNTPGFEKENTTKPKECAIMSGRAKILQPEQIAEAFIDGILKNKFNILPGEAKFIWKMYRHFPKLVRSVIDRDYKKARKKLGKS